MKKHNFRDYDHDQASLLMVSFKKMLSPDHPAVIVNHVINKLDLTKLYDKYSNEGKPPYHPQMMLKVLVYAYYKESMSCREIWDELEHRADFIYLAAGQVPNFRTINSFRLRHLDILPDLFTQIVLLCKQLDLISFKHLAIDGEKIHGNASFKQNKSLNGLQEEYKKVKRGLKKLLAKEITEDFTEAKKNEQEQKILKKLSQVEGMQKTLEEIINAKKNDTDDDNDENSNLPGNSSDKPIRKKGRRRKKKDTNEIKINMTDNDAIPLQHKDNRVLPSYNHQSAVDGKYGIVCAVNTKNNHDQPDDLFLLVHQAMANTKGEFKNVMADSAFGSYDVYERITNDQSETTEYFIPNMRYSAQKSNRRNGAYEYEKFKMNDNSDLVCPEGKVVKYLRTAKKNGRMQNIYKCYDCPGCPVHDKCTKLEYRHIHVDVRLKYLQEMRSKLDSDRGREIYSKRKGIVEPVHGDDQKNRNWIQHHLRSLKKATGEFLLMRIGTNLRKIVKYGNKEQLAMI